MSNCNDCHFAVWQKTKAGKLHPSGEGECTFKPWVKWQIPYAYYYPPAPKNPVTAPQGGQINRRIQLKGKCPFFQHKKPEAT